MKKYILFGLLIIFSTLSWAQRSVSAESPEKKSKKITVSTLVNRALFSGRGDNGKGFYMIRVPQKTHIPIEEFRAYMLKNKYYLVQGSNWALGSMIKFGNRLQTIASADFLPENEVGDYIAGISSNFMKEGKAYILLSYNSTAMDVHWDAQVNDGYIEGYGTGVASLGNGKYYIFTGGFKNGIANGNCTVTLATAKISESGVFYPDETKKEIKDSYFVSDFVDGYAQYSKDNKWGFINKNASVIISPTYKKIVSSFGFESYAIVLNNKDEEIKIDKSGVEWGYSDHQLAINEEARKAKEREEARKAEEKRKSERKDAEQKKYNSAKSYYESFNNNAFTTAYNEYMKEYPNDNSDHRSELEKMKSNVQARDERIAAGKDFSKWRMGNQVCVSHNGGILLGLVEKFNEDRSAAEVKIVAGPSGEYNGQTLKKNGTIWVQRGSSWHLAIDEEIAYAQSNSSVRDPSLEPKVIYKESTPSGPKLCSKCAGRGTEICVSCRGRGIDFRDRVCDLCKGKGSYRCDHCRGTGYEP